MGGTADSRSRVPLSERSVLVDDGSSSLMADLYESTTFEAVHASVLDLLPTPGCSVLDVGAGSGRDAAALSKRGYAVTAVEPSAGLRREALNRHPDAGILWVDDVLPSLSKVNGQSFALILVSAVWMYIAPRDRPAAMLRLAQALETGGRLIISVRIGPDDPARSIIKVDLPVLVADAVAAGLTLVRRVESGDSLRRASVKWTTLVFGKPSRAA